ncbi:MAG: hypothetical protein ASUL_09699 [Candidatus Aramenus sulfurataquae]|uniref:Uncharacterized protein n=1 Tax=Candidatus Aramenus sulfurataquae TaxID=1326980 RepID=W7L4B1_9CREN|nr:MAG: hypothetical protein ASUL_09699 [Candidatus Aramenus sulfurataquae]
MSDLSFKQVKPEECVALVNPGAGEDKNFRGGKGNNEKVLQGSCCHLPQALTLDLGQRG